MDVSKSFKSIEELYRYLITGISFGIIFYLSRKPFELIDKDINWILISIVFLAVGMATYAIYRLFYFVTFDWLFFKFKWTVVSDYGKDYINATGEYLRILSDDPNKERKDYLSYRFGLIHYVMYLSFVTILLTCYSIKPSFLYCNKCCVLIISVSVLILGLGNYYFTHKMCRTYIPKNNFRIISSNKK